MSVHHFGGKPPAAIDIAPYEGLDLAVVTRCAAAILEGRYEQQAVFAAADFEGFGKATDAHERGLGPPGTFVIAGHQLGVFRGGFRIDAASIRDAGKVSRKKIIE